MKLMKKGLQNSKNFGKKSIIFSVMIFFLLACITSVYAGELELSDIKVYVDGDRDYGVDETGGKIDYVKPEDVVKFEIRVKNTFDEDEDFEIQDIAVKATIEEIDDGDDMVMEEDDFDLEAEKRNTVTFEFKMPLEVKNGIYDVYIEVDGEDEDGTDYSHDVEIDLDLDKDSHRLKIYELDLLSETVSCGKSTELAVGVINIGKNREDVDLFISNSDLEISIKDEYSLSREAFDSDNKHSENYLISVPSNAKAGDYELNIKARSPDTANITKINLKVECDAPTTTQTSQPSQTQTTTQTTTTTPSSSTQTTTTKDKTTTQDIIVVEKSFLGEYKWPITVAVLYIIAILIAIFLVRALIKQRR